MDERNDNDIELQTTESEENHIEDTELEDEEEQSGQKLKKLREKLKACEQDKMVAMEDLQRAKADFLNARKRLDEEKVLHRERTQLQFIDDLLPLCDSFTMALNDPAFKEMPENVKKGVMGINMQLSSILRGYGVTEFGVIGEKFDPNLHEALADEGEGHVVKNVLQKGYKMNDKIVRPAKVIVE